MTSVVVILAEKEQRYKRYKFRPANVIEESEIGMSVLQKLQKHMGIKADSPSSSAVESPLVTPSRIESPLPFSSDVSTAILTPDGMPFTPLLY